MGAWMRMAASSSAPAATFARIAGGLLLLGTACGSEPEATTTMMSPPAQTLGTLGAPCTAGEACTCAGIGQGQTTCPAGPRGASTCECASAPMAPPSRPMTTPMAPTGTNAPAPMAGAGGPMAPEPDTTMPAPMMPPPMRPTFPRPPMSMDDPPEPMEPAMMPDPVDPPAGGDPSDELAALRQFCVEHINMYRATLDLSPVEAANAEQNDCSDMGAQKDATTGGPHSSAGDCRQLGLPGAQNTCPGYPVRGGDLMGALRTCLDQMWDEGEPAEGIPACIADRAGCFLRHGHYINMVGEHGLVSCGFYEMDDGRWWMNQNFGR